MTQDFEKNLKEYFTGNLIEETGVDTPQFKEPITSNKNVRKQIADLLELEAINVVVSGELYDDNFNTFLIYGYTYVGNVNTYYIALFDKDINLIQYINKFSSGADLFSIRRMKRAEDGTIYALSQESDYTIRILLLNNIFASNINTSEYQVKIRASYIMPSNMNLRVTPITASKDIIVKAPNEATYYLTGYAVTGDTHTRVVKFTINVGSSNEWVDYDFPSDTYIAQSKFSVLLNKTNNGIEYNVYGLDTNTYRYREFKIDEDGNVTNTKNINTEFSWQNNEVLALNKENIYVTRNDYVSQMVILSKVNGNAFIDLYNVPFGELGQHIGAESYIILKQVNNNLFVANYKCINDYYETEYGIVIGENYYLFDNIDINITYNYKTISSIFYEFYITNSYNLYTLYLMGDEVNGEQEFGSARINLIYNTNNYNGVPFKNKNSMIPSSGNLYSNNELIFARDLYNKTINNSTTTSSLQIPNTMLNDVTINKEELISENNNMMTSNNEIINKNIFEELNINFINTILMKNANDPSNIIINQLGANRINNSISNLLDYDNSKMGKYRINYIDNTQITGTNIWAPIGNYYRTIISVSSNKKISSIDFLSNDETMVYQTIRPDLEIGKIYKIKQDVYINTKEEPNEVLYGIDEVFYKNEKVYY